MQPRAKTYRTVMPKFIFILTCKCGYTRPDLGTGWTGPIAGDLGNRDGTIARVTIKKCLNLG